MNQTDVRLSDREKDHLRNLRLFTLGYQLIPAEEFLEELGVAGVNVVVDVRETAWSRKPGFSASQLREALSEVGIEYVHAPFAGNPKELRKNISEHQECLRRYASHLSEHPGIIDQLTELLLDVDSASGVCFICYERHPDDCHRSILLNHWKDEIGEEFSVEHLSPNGAPRFV